MKIDKILIFSFFSFSVMHQIIGAKDDLFFLRMAQLIGMSSFFRILFSQDLSKVLKRTHHISFKVLLVCIASTVAVELFNARLYLLDLIYPLSFFSVSYLIIKTKPSPTIFIGVSILTFVFLFSKYLQGYPPAEWVKGSRNFVSVLGIYLTITTIAVSNLYTKKANLIVHFGLPLLTVVFSVLALGRSGIISSLLIFLVSSLHLVNSKGRQNVSKYVFFLILIGLGIFIYQYIDYIESSFLYKFERKGIDLDERADVITMYLNSMDMYAFFFSYPSLDWIFAVQGITLHNSYLHWHFSFGFGAFIILYLIFRSSISIYKLSKYMCFLLLIIMIRSFSDQVLLSDGILLGLPLILIVMTNDYRINMGSK